MKTTSRPFQELLGYVKRSRLVETRTKKSLEWYRTKIRVLFGDKHLDARDIFDRQKYRTLPLPGSIITFNYTPKHAATLPYYDRFPIVLVLHLGKRGFLGLNLHYLKLTHRAYFMALLYNYQKYNQRTKTMIINMRYEILKNTQSLRYYKPCIKRYLNSKIGSFYYNIPPEEWDIALFLPYEKFEKETRETVWRDSSRMIK